MLELSTPMRVTWEVGIDAGAIRRILQRLQEGRALFVEALVTCANAPLLADNLAGMQTFSPSLTVVGDLSALKVFTDLSDRASRISAALLYGGEKAEEIKPIAGAFKALSIALWSTDEGMKGFPCALGAARELSLPLSVLNPPAPAAPISESTLGEAAKAWNDCDGVKLTAHDLFLAERLGLDPWKNYRGCAAGQSLAHVAAEGRLLACRTLPVEFGSLLEESMKELWKLGVRTELRRLLGVPPNECSPCVRAASCLGGCPGLASPGVRDLSCPGPVGA